MKEPIRGFVGSDRSPVLIVDEVAGSVADIVAIAGALAPFPAARNSYYPGLRRFITAADGAAVAYVQDVLRKVAGAISATFDVDGFDLLDASFSMVTAHPSTLMPAQRAPHFDSVDPNHLAVLHYLSGTEGTGTAFYRHRATGIERVTAANNAAFVDAAGRESPLWSGYMSTSNDWFEQIGAIAAIPDRLLVYHGSLLHSGSIPPGMVLGDDPLTGRLTANFFVRGRASRLPSGRGSI